MEILLIEIFDKTAEDLNNLVNEYRRNLDVECRNIREVVKEQISAFEEVAAIVQELSSMSKLLKEETDKFKVE